MISVDIGHHRFQLRAAAIFIRDGHVLLHRLEADTFWSLPGGRVEPGEDGMATVVREMVEELGEHVVCGPLLYVAENFFEARGQPHHELGLYFQAHLPDESALLDQSRSHAGQEGRHTLEFRWFALAALDGLDVRPAFLKRALVQSPLAFEHVVQRG